jgi:hypothetical protein
MNKKQIQRIRELFSQLEFLPYQLQARKEMLLSIISEVKCDHQLADGTSALRGWFLYRCKICRRWKLKNRELTNEQYIRMLKKLRTLIESGLKLELDDSNEIGNKYTHASWGQCTNEHWDKDSLFRKDAPFLGSKTHAKGQFCPFDTRINPPGHSSIRNSPMGCFYRCRLFQATKAAPAPTREQALQLYDITIGTFEKAHPPE